MGDVPRWAEAAGVPADDAMRPRDIDPAADEAIRDAARARRHARSRVRREQYPRCPYARLGLDAVGMQSCEGYVPKRLGVVDIAPWEVAIGRADGVTCAFLGIQESARGGFVSACLSSEPPAPIEAPTLVGPGHPVEHHPDLVPHRH